MTGSLRINVSGLQDKELDIPYIEDTSATKPKVVDDDGCERVVMFVLQHTSKRVVLRRLSQDSEGKMLSCEIHLPSMKTSTMVTPGTDSLIYRSDPPSLAVLTLIVPVRVEATEEPRPVTSSPTM